MKVWVQLHDTVCWNFGGENGIGAGFWFVNCGFSFVSHFPVAPYSSVMGEGKVGPCDATVSGDSDPIPSQNYLENSMDEKSQLDVTFCILYFSSNSC